MSHESATLRDQSGFREDDDEQGVPLASLNDEQLPGFPASQAEADARSARFYAFAAMHPELLDGDQDAGLLDCPRLLAAYMRQYKADTSSL